MNKHLTNLALVLTLTSVIRAAEAEDKPSPIRYHSVTAPVQKQAATPEVQPKTRAANQQPALLTAAAAEPISADGVQTGTACYYKPSSKNLPEGAPAPEERMTAVHPTLPIGTRVHVTNLANNRSVEVTITDHGLSATGRIISLSRRAADQLGFVSAGTAQVRVELTNHNLQTGM